MPIQLKVRRIGNVWHRETDAALPAELLPAPAAAAAAHRRLPHARCRYRATRAAQPRCGNSTAPSSAWTRCARLLLRWGAACQCRRAGTATTCACRGLLLAWLPQLWKIKAVAADLYLDMLHTALVSDALHISFAHLLISAHPVLWLVCVQMPPDMFLVCGLALGLISLVFKVGGVCLVGTQQHWWAFTAGQPAT